MGKIGDKEAALRALREGKRKPLPVAEVAAILAKPLRTKLPNGIFVPGSEVDAASHREVLGAIVQEGFTLVRRSRAKQAAYMRAYRARKKEAKNV